MEGVEARLWFYQPIMIGTGESDNDTLPLSGCRAHTFGFNAGFGSARTRRARQIRAAASRRLPKTCAVRSTDKQRRERALDAVVR